MSDVIHRTNRIKLKLERRFNQHTPNFIPPLSSDWIINPDLSALVGVPEVYWKIAGETVVEMDAGEKASVDMDLADAVVIAAEKVVTSRVHGHTPLYGYSIDVTISGLTLTVSIDSLVDSAAIVFTADSSQKKFVTICYTHVEADESYTLVPLEKLDGEFDEYADLDEGETCIGDLGEWSVVAGGTTLVLEG